VSDKKSTLPKANREIKATEVRLINSDGEMLGIFPTNEALKKAYSLSLDLVEISPTAEPPVCKILDFGKYKYEAKKKITDAKKKQKVVSLKELKLRPNIGQSDFEVKMKSCKKFIEEGDKVKITLWFKGREFVHQELGDQLIEKIIESTKEYSKIESAPKKEGKNVTMTLVGL
jgi:translation initiation factor IF-3